MKGVLKRLEMLRKEGSPLPPDAYFALVLLWLLLTCTTALLLLTAGRRASPRRLEPRPAEAGSSSRPAVSGEVQP